MTADDRRLVATIVRAWLRLDCDDGTETRSIICNTWEDGARSLIADALARGFGWYVAYWPHCPRAIFRLKSATQRAEWDRRQWIWFGGERPIIDNVTDLVWQMCTEIIKPEAHVALGLLYNPATRRFDLTREPGGRFDLTSTMCSHSVPLPKDELPSWVKPSQGEFYPPSEEPNPFRIAVDCGEHIPGTPWPGELG